MFRLPAGGVLAVAALLIEATLAGVPTMSPAPASAEVSRAAGHQTFLVISTNPAQDADSTIAATGPIHAKGTDVVASNRKDLFKFPNGDLVIQHRRTKGSAHDSFDQVTCLFSFTEKGTWKVGDGSTGAYANATGSGTYRVVGQGFSCDENTQPDPFSLKINAKGTLSY